MPHYHEDQQGLSRREQILRQARADYKAALDNEAHIQWRKEAKEDFDFVAGGAGMDSGQWDREALETLEQQQRPAITVNRIEPLIEGVAGTEVNNRQEATYKPREPADTGLTSVLNAVGKWMRDNDVEEEDSDAFRNALVCGLGATASAMQYDEDLDGRFEAISLDPLGLRWDVNARRTGLTDTRWRGFVQDLDPRTFASMFPGDHGQEGVFGDSEPISTTSEPARRNTDYDDPLEQDGPPNEPRTYRVFQYQWYEHEPVYRVANPRTGSLDDLSREEFNALRDQIEASGGIVTPFGTPVDLDPDEPEPPVVVRFVQQERRVYYQAFFSGDNMLGDIERSPWRHGFTIQFITGRRHHNKGTFYGLVRPMKDPQRMTNKILSQFVHHYNSNVKGGGLYEEDAILNPEFFRDNVAAPNPWLPVAPGAISQKKIQFMQPAQFPGTLDALLQFFFSVPPSVTGLSEEFIGLAGRDQPVGLEQTRKMATLSIVAPVFSSYRKYRKQQGRLILDFIKDYIPEDAINRIVAEPDRQFVPLVARMSPRRFDVHVDDAPLNPSMKATVYSVLKDFMQFAMSALPPPVMQQYLAAFLDYSPLPQALVTALKEAGQKAAQPSPEQIEARELAKRAQEAETLKDRMDALLKQAKAITELSKPGTEQDQLDLKAADEALNFVQTMAQLDVQAAKQTRGD